MTNIFKGAGVVWHRSEYNFRNTYYWFCSLIWKYWEYNNVHDTARCYTRTHISSQAIAKRTPFFISICDSVTTEYSIRL